jgi:hypothetical protein
VRACQGTDCESLKISLRREKANPQYEAEKDTDLQIRWCRDRMGRLTEMRVRPLVVADNGVRLNEQTAASSTAVRCVTSAQFARDNSNVDRHGARYRVLVVARALKYVLEGPRFGHKGDDEREVTDRPKGNAESETGDAGLDNAD